MIRAFAASSDTLNLPSTPTSSNMFTFGHSFSSFPYTMPLFSETLLAFLNAGNISDEDATSVLEEYAWSSIVAGKRVREYCEDLTEVISKLNKPSAVQRLLYTGVLATLFPFIRVTSTYLPSPPPLPAPIVSPNHLSSITRKQLIDALSKFSTSSPQSLYTEGLIFEVIVEYIGRRWRSGESDIVENIARKLTEVEFEIQVQGDLSTVKTTIQPALQKARFLLGFLSVTQLITRLNAMSGTSLPKSDRVRPNPDRLIRSYIIRRLAAGNDPTLVVYDLVAAQDKVNSASHKDILISTIASFGLQSESPTPNEFGRGSTDTLLAPISPTTSFGPTISPRRATFSRLASKLTTKRHIPPAPKWLSHRKASMSVSRLHLPDFNTDRRPSLPTIPCIHASPTFKPVKSPLAMASMSSIHTIRRIIPEESPELDEFGGRSGDLTVRILSMRYRVSKDGGWFLGSGKETARELLRCALNDSDNVQAVHDISALFDIILFPTPPPVPRPVTPPGEGVIGGRRGSSPVNWLPPAPCLVPLSLGHGHDGDPMSPLSIASFDLDEYYARMSSGRSSHGAKLSMGTMTTDLDFMSSDPHAQDTSPDARSRKRRSAGLESLMTMNTGFTGFTYGRASRLSNYSIREATKEYTSSAMATTFSMPHLPKVMLDDNDLDLDSPSDEDDSDPRPTHRHTRSRSETDLLAMIKPEQASSPFPSRFSSLRRMRPINPKTGISLSAWDLGLGHLVPTSPTPLPRFNHQPPSDDMHYDMNDQSLLVGMVPPSPPISPTSSTCNTPRAGTFPLPPDDVPYSPSRVEDGTYVPSKPHTNRQYTIINGEVSPSRCSEDSQDYFGLPPVIPDGDSLRPRSMGQPDFTRPMSSIQPAREKALPIPPRTSSLHSGRSSHSARPLSSGPETPLSLAFSLFAFSRLPPPPQAPVGHLGYEIVAARSDLTVDEVNVVLGGMIDSEKARIKSRGKHWDDAARCRIGWLMDQVGDMLNDPRFAPIIDVHLDRLAPASLKTGMLNPPSPMGSSPKSSPGSIKSRDHLYPSSPLTVLHGHSTLSLPLEDTTLKAHSSPRPPPRKLAPAMPVPKDVEKMKEPRMVPLTPTREASRRPLPRTPRRDMGSLDSTDSGLTSKLSIGTFGH